MKRETFGEKIFYVVNYILIGLIALIAIYPFIFVVSESLSSSRAIAAGEVLLLPVETNVQAYVSVFQDGQIFNAMGNTVIITLVGTALSLFCTILCAFALSHKRLYGRNGILIFISITMVIGAGMIPNFILVKLLGLMNTFWSLWLPGLMSTVNMIIIKTSFEHMPASLSEAAEIDGANDMMILWKIVLPLSLPTVATIALFSAVGWWNSYFNAMMYITQSSKYPLMVQLMNMIQQAQMAQASTDSAMQVDVAPETYKAASIVISTIPIICVYPFLQKYFVKGVMVGSIKG